MIASNGGRRLPEKGKKGNFTRVVGTLRKKKEKGRVPSNRGGAAMKSDGKKKREVVSQEKKLQGEKIWKKKLGVKRPWPERTPAK